MINLGDIVYTFQGESLLELTVIKIIDYLRVSAEDSECVYCLWKKFCYDSPEEAFVGMQKAMLLLRRGHNF